VFVGEKKIIDECPKECRASAESLFEKVLASCRILVNLLIGCRCECACTHILVVRVRVFTYTHTLFECF